jgi:thiamine kinase-like enzyme
MGPFKTEADFNLFLRNGIENTEKMEEGSLKTDMDRLIEMHQDVEAKHLQPVFTHGDISGSNILVRNGRVVALIDFEMSGFYPEYWEYATAMRSNHAKGWREQIPRFLTPYPMELGMANLWRNHFCDWGA